MSFPGQKSVNLGIFLQKKIPSKCNWIGLRPMVHRLGMLCLCQCFWFQAWLQLLVLGQCWVLVLPRGSARGRSRLANEVQTNDISGKAACPTLRFRRRGCVVKYECETKCTEKKKCRTRYQYKCTDYRRQECKNVWQNQCNGKRKGRRRRKRSPRPPPYWLDPANTNTVDDPPPPQDPSGLALLDPGTGGQVFDFPVKPRSSKCWKKVRKCEYKKYRTVCGNKPVKTCDDKPTTDCKKSCKNVYYCDKCPGKPTTPRPTRPTGPPRPTRPTKRPVGPPAPPPPGTFIVSAPGPPKLGDEVVIDAKRRSKRRRERPWTSQHYLMSLSDNSFILELPNMLPYHEQFAAIENRIQYLYRPWTLKVS